MDSRAATRLSQFSRNPSTDALPQRQPVAGPISLAKVPFPALKGIGKQQHNFSIHCSCHINVRRSFLKQLSFRWLSIKAQCFLTVYKWDGLHHAGSMSHKYMDSTRDMQHSIAADPHSSKPISRPYPAYKPTTGRSQFYTPPQI